MCWIRNSNRSLQKKTRLSNVHKVIKRNPTSYQLQISLLFAMSVFLFSLVIFGKHTGMHTNLIIFVFSLPRIDACSQPNLNQYTHRSTQRER